MLQITLFLNDVNKFSDIILVDRIKELIFECAKINNWYIESLSIENESIVIKMGLELELSIEEIVVILKKGIYKSLKQENFVVENLWKDFYFAETLDGRYFHNVDDESNFLVSDNCTLCTNINSQ